MGHKTRFAKQGFWAAFVFLLAVSTTQAASPYGNCDALFVEKKPPTISGAKITPLCEEDRENVFFATGYSTVDNRGIWSAYRLDQEDAIILNNDPLPRPKMRFRQNEKLKAEGYVQPIHDSYTGTGWDRGHLAPNGAMAWDEKAQIASFYLSNIAPQNPGMNRNIWRCFEHSIREWAEDSKVTHVVVGAAGRLEKPILSDKPARKVPITVPTHYVAMVYRELASGAPIAIGVRVPNTSGHLDIKDYIVSVNELEKETGFKFNLPAEVSRKKPNLHQWPTRIVKREILGRLPEIDVQCPRVN